MKICEYVQIYIFLGSFVQPKCDGFFGVDESVSVSYSREECPSKGESQIFWRDNCSHVWLYVPGIKTDYELFASKSS